ASPGWCWAASPPRWSRSAAYRCWSRADAPTVFASWENAIMDDTVAPAKPRSLGIRALLMLLMLIAFELTKWVLLGVAVLQLVLSVATDSANDRLRSFGGALGRYLGQIADFVSFRTEDLPFPFSDWPSQPPAA